MRMGTRACQCFHPRAIGMGRVPSKVCPFAALAELNAQQRAEIEECFNALDTDSSGAIDADEIVHVGPIGKASLGVGAIRDAAYLDVQARMCQGARPPLIAAC